MLELNYEMLARDVVGELASQGSLKDLTRHSLRGLLNRYRRQLKDVMQRRLYSELKRLGRLGPYLQRAIPAYQLFLRQAVAQARSDPQMEARTGQVLEPAKGLYGLNWPLAGRVEVGREGIALT
jgi:hypothetical protein